MSNNEKVITETDAKTWAQGLLFGITCGLYIASLMELVILHFGFGVS